MSDQQSSSDLTYGYSIDGSENLNRARILSPSSLDSTPSTKKGKSPKNQKKPKMKKVKIVSSDQDSEQWRNILTKSSRKYHQKLDTPQKQQNNKKSIRSSDKTADVKNKKGGKYQNLCPVCLSEFALIRGSLDCMHQFCYDCIKTWCQNSSICPCCRKQITSILKLTRVQPDKLVSETERISVERKQLKFQTQYDHYLCYQCGSGDNEHILLICDQCDFYCCHVYCDPELNNIIPSGDWYCIYCRTRRRRRRNTSNPSSSIISEIIRASTSQRTLSTDNISSSSQDIQKGVSSRTRSRQVINSIQRHNMNTLRQIRRRVQ